MIDPTPLLHPLGLCVGTAHQRMLCQGLNFYSGIGSDLGEATLISTSVALILGLWYKHNCHIPRCPRLSWHPHPDHGHPVCRKHHPHGDQLPTA